MSLSPHTTAQLGYRGSPWRTIGSGIVLGIVAVALFFMLRMMEQQALSVEMPWIFVKLYEFGGVWGVSGAVGLLAAGTLAWGIAGLVRRPAQGTIPPAQAELNSALAAGMGFSLEELEINRRGQLSPRQQQQIADLSFKGTVGSAIAGLVGLLVTAGAFAYVYFFAPTGAALRDSLPASQVLPIAGGVLGFVVLLIIGSIVRNGGFGSRGLRAAEGRVKLSSTSLHGASRAVSQAMGYGSAACAVQIGRQRFAVKQQVLDAFLDGGRYRLYYIPNGAAPYLISAEALG